MKIKEIEVACGSLYPLGLRIWLIVSLFQGRMHVEYFMYLVRLDEVEEVD